MDIRRNIKMVVAYQGTRYCGWQRQKDVSTVQGTIEDVLGEVVGKAVRIQGASRTDGGVHAEGQVANFYVEDCSIPAEAFAEILNGRLPSDIAVRESSLVADNFHSSGDAVCKSYFYRIYNASTKDVMLFNFRWQVDYPLDVDAMNEAAKFLIGTHDFCSLSSAKDTRENTVRTILEAEAWRFENEIIFRVRANRFLYLMVRNIVGTLVEIGRGRWSAEQMAKIIAGRDRRLAGPTAPGHGLCLKKVEYF